jgi:hypothetical protein
MARQETRAARSKNSSHREIMTFDKNLQRSATKKHDRQKMKKEIKKAQNL